MNQPRNAVRRLALPALVSALAIAIAGILVGNATAGAAAPPELSANHHLAMGLAAAEPTGSTVTTVSTSGRSQTLTVAPLANLAPAGAQITVTGSGFDSDHDLWVAVCQDDGVAPAALLHCIGGAIPDQNATTGWGVVTSASNPPFAGPVVAAWQAGGSFELTLQIPAAVGDTADCVSAPCRVYTRSSDDADRSEDIGVPVSFAAPPAESSTVASNESSTPPSTTSASSPAPSTETLGGTPTTVTPEGMLQTTVPIGGTQTVVFTGFTPGEQVDVTLYSDPVTLPSVNADSVGSVRISFSVPADLDPGEHILQAIGQQSGRVGIARFSVAAAPSSASSADQSVTESAVQSATESAVTESALSSVASSSAVSSAESISASSATAAALPADTDTGAGGNRLLWLWITLGVLAIIGGTAGVVALARGRRPDEPRPSARQLPDPYPVEGSGVYPGTPSGRYPEASSGPYPATPAPGTRAPAGGFGLLSGRDHPDGPALYSGGWPQPPTGITGPVSAPGQGATGASVPPAVGDHPSPEDLPTQAWSADSISPQGPPTQAWSPRDLPAERDDDAKGTESDPNGRHRAD